jgi:NADH dehydrogenase
MCFDDVPTLTESLRGAHTLYNTYWVRFDHGARTYERAITNTRALLVAARDAGVRRIVHVSITNPSLDSPLPYFRGKALLEEDIQGSGLSYAILRPAVIFGNEDILINNIAYFLRRLPLFIIPGSGRYRLQPIFAEDLAHLALQAGQSDTNVVLDAVGPEIFSFNDLVSVIAATVKSRAKIVHFPASPAFTLIRFLSVVLGDIVLTLDELNGLRADLLVSRAAPTGTTRLSKWLEENADSVGSSYASELKKHYRG